MTDFVLLTTSGFCIILGVVLMRLCFWVLFASPAEKADAERWHQEQKRRRALIRALPASPQPQPQGDGGKP